MFGYNSVEVKEMVSTRYELTDEHRNKINHYFENKKGRPYKNVRFCKWQETGLFEKIFTDLALECDLQDVSIDSTIIKVHQSAGSKKKKQ